MMSPEVLEAENRALADKRTGEKQSINPTNSGEESDVGIQIVDSRDDLFAEQEDQYPSSNNESVKEQEVADDRTQYEAAAAVGREDKGSADAQMVNELREALLKVRENNRHLQSENDHIKEEYICLADVAHKMAEDWAALREENEQLLKELEMLKTGKADSTPSNITSSTLSDVSSASTSLKGDRLLDFDDSSHANDLHSLPFTIDADFQYIPIAQQGSVDSDDVLDNEETVKFIDRPSNINSHSRNMSDLSLSLKSRDTLYDINELKITTTNDGDDEDVTLRMKLELKRDECNDLRKDLGKIAEAFWQQTEELTECQSRVVKLQTENDELRCLKWIETEVDTMWSHVKEMDKVKDVCDHLMTENDELRASVSEKSNEIAELKLVQSKVDDVQEDLEALLLELKASLVEKTNEIEELKEQHRNAPCPDWVQSSIDEIREDLEVILAEREQLQATVVRKSHEIADLKEQLRNINERT